jgi:hypothetical protein
VKTVVSSVQRCVRCGWSDWFYLVVAAACLPFSPLFCFTDAGEDEALETKPFAAMIVFRVSFRLNK